MIWKKILELLFVVPDVELPSTDVIYKKPVLNKIKKRKKQNLFFFFFFLKKPVLKLISELLKVEWATF